MKIKNSTKQFIPVQLFNKLAIADDRVSTSLKSVIIAIERETLALVTPPTMRLNKNIIKRLENDQIMYERSVPNF